MSLIERLRAEGELDSHGSFTLDWSKAREKMARFQLTDPRRYALEVVEAAVALGARSLEVEIAAGVEFRFGGTPLPTEALQRLDDYLLSTPSTPEEHAFRALAMALAALGTLKASKVRLETPAGRWIERTARGETSGSGSFSRHRLRVEGTRGWTWGLGASPEEKLLRAEACFAPIPLRVNGQDVRVPPHLEGLGAEFLEERGGGGFLAVVDPSPAASVRALVESMPGSHLGEVDLPENASTVTFLSRGVLVGWRVLTLPVPLKVLAWHDGLARNASHSDLVEDEAFAAVVRDLEGLALRGADRLARDLAAGKLGRQAEPARVLLVDLVGRQKPPLAQAFEEAPLLRDQTGRPLSLAELETQREALKLVPYLDRPLQESLPDLRVVRVDHHAEKALLAARFGADAQDAQAHVLALLRRRRNQERWEASPRPACLPPGEWILRRPLADPPGEVGLSPLDTDAGSLLHVLYRGRLLESRDLPGSLSYVAVLDFAELEVDDSFERALDSAPWRRALEALEREGQGLYRDLALRGGPFTEPERAHLLLGLAAGGPGHRLQSGPFWGLPLFQDLRGGFLSLEQIAREGAWLVEAEEGRLPPGLPPEVLSQRPYVQVGPQERKILEAALPGRTEPGEDEMARLRRLEVRFSERRRPRLGDPELFLLRIPVAKGDVTGQLGLRVEGTASSVELLRGGVWIETRNVKASGPAFQAVVECPRLAPNAAWSAVVNDAAWMEVLELVRAAEGRARRVLVERWADGSLDSCARDAVEEVLALDPSMVDLLGPRPTFRSTGGLVPLSRLREDLERWGCLLVTPPDRPVTLPDRLVFPQDAANRLAAILPGARLEPVAPHLERLEAEQAFRTRPKSPPRLEGRCLLERGLEPPREGRVALVASSGGSLAIHWEGRLLQSLPGLLPLSIRAAVEDPALQPEPSFQAVARDSSWKALLDTLALEVGRLAEEALGKGPPPNSAMAWALLELLVWEPLPGPLRDRLWKAPLLRILPDESVSLDEVRRRLGKASHLPVVPPDAFGTPRNGRLVVAAGEDVSSLLGRLLGRPARNDSANLERDLRYEAHLQKASTLSRKLPRCLVELPVEGPLLRGSLGFPAGPVPASFLALREGRALGTMEMPHHRCVGVLEGDFELGADGTLKEPGRELRRELRSHQVELYRALVRVFPSLAGGPRARATEALLGFAAEERSALGGRNAASEVVEELLELPLVEVCGGRRVSVRALAAEAKARGRLSCLPRRPLVSLHRGEDLLPVLPAGSPQRLLCERALGSGLLEEVPMPTLGERLGAAGEVTAGALARATGTALGWLGTLFEFVAPPSNAPADRERLAVLAELDRAAPEPDSPEVALVKALRREFSLVTRGRVRRHAVRMFERLAWSFHPLGPPAWHAEGVLYLNRMDGTVGWIRDHWQEDPGALSLLLAHLVGLANEALEEVRDPDEQAFLEELVRDLEGSFPS